MWSRVDEEWGYEAVKGSWKNQNVRTERERASERERERVLKGLSQNISKVNEKYVHSLKVIKKTEKASHYEVYEAYQSTNTINVTA